MWNVDHICKPGGGLHKNSLDAGVRATVPCGSILTIAIAPGNGDDGSDASYHHWLYRRIAKYGLTRRTESLSCCRSRI